MKKASLDGIAPEETLNLVEQLSELNTLNIKGSDDDWETDY